MRRKNWELEILTTSNSVPHPGISGLNVTYIGNWHIYGHAYHLMLKTAMVYLNISGKDWQLAAIPKIPQIWIPMQLLALLVYF